MNITQIKLFFWLAAAATGAGLGWIVKDFVQNHKTIAEPPSNEVMKETVDTVPEPPKPKTDLVDYNRVLVTLKDLNWTGTPPPPPPPEPGPDDDVQRAPPVTPVSEILGVLFITQDTSRPERSFVLVGYKSGALAADPGSATLRAGDSLPDPHADISVVEILAQGVVFTFADEERENETVGPPEFAVDSPIVFVATGDIVIQPVVQQFNTSVYVSWPDQTRAIGRDQYQLGTDDQEYLRENWSEVLARDVRSGKWKNPATGRYEGIELKGLSKNAYASKYGLGEGDVIKSINGHPVSSQAEAISFVKTESKDKTIEKWYVVVSSMGKDKTIVVHSP
jgi:hypothetical protein